MNYQRQTPRGYGNTPYGYAGGTDEPLRRPSAAQQLHLASLDALNGNLSPATTAAYGAPPPPQPPQTMPHNMPPPGPQYSLRGSPHLGGQQQRGGFSPQDRHQPQFVNQTPPMNAAQRVQQDPDRRRKQEVDKLIHDCYSKYVPDRTGQKVPEVAYQTHIRIKEYLLFPSQPPINVPSDQIGSVKDRVLVICVKSSGRVLLQKGKFNSAKNAYQIGRTWDLDELRVVNRVLESEIVLLINKDYYWRVEEPRERLWKFTRFLCQTYGLFTGKYPRLSGYSLEELKLPPSPVAPNTAAVNLTDSPVLNEPLPNPQLLKKRLLKRKHLPNPVLPLAPLPVVLNIPQTLPALPKISQNAQTPPVSNAQNLYKDMDFTVNGKLPEKPMVPMQVARPGANQDQGQNEADPLGSLFGLASQPSTQPSSGNEKSFKSLREDAIGQASATLERSTPSENSADNSYDRSGPSTTNIGRNLPKSHSRNFSHDLQTSVHKQTHPYLRISVDTAGTSELEEFHDTNDSLSFVFAPANTSNNSDRTMDRSLGSIRSRSIRSKGDGSEKLFGQNISPDFGIEEADSDGDGDGASDYEEQPLNLGANSAASASRSQYDYEQATPDLRSLSQKQLANDDLEVPSRKDSGANDAIDPVASSIQEIEAFMQTQLDPSSHEGRDGSKIVDSVQPDQFRSIHNQFPSLQTQLQPPGQQRGLMLPNSTARVQLMDDDVNLFDEQMASPVINQLFLDVSSATTRNTNVDIHEDDEDLIEKDPEIEEWLDEVNWTSTDDCEALLKKLNGELNRVKYKNVKEVIGLDFSRNDIAEEISISLAEIQNLNHIFKKMEIDLQEVAPDVHEIEVNSRGLQVKSVNKRILYNDLKSILGTVNMDNADLDFIERFSQFDRVKLLEQLEGKLRSLYDALGAMRSETASNLPNGNNEISSMKALKQYRELYEQVSTSFIYHFKSFIEQRFHNSVNVLTNEVHRVSVGNIIKELNDSLIYSGVMCFVKDIAFNDFNQISDNFFYHLGLFMDKLLAYQLSEIKHTSIPSVADLGENLRKKSTRHSTRSKFKLRSSTDHSAAQTEDLGGKNEVTNHTLEVQDSNSLMELISFSADLIAAVQYFVGTEFHYELNRVDFIEYTSTKPFNERRRMLESPAFKSSRSFSNEILPSMTTIFGGYINTFMKKVSPTESHIPLITAYLQHILDDNKTTNQDFLLFNFLKRAIDKFEAKWDKTLKHKVEAFNLQAITSKSGLLPVVKDFGLLVVIAESSLQNESITLEKSHVRAKLDSSYKKLNEAAIHLFLRDDPLLKNSEYDEKERHHRRISILINIFYLCEQFAAYSSPGTAQLRNELENVFKKVEALYFKHVMLKHIGKIMEVVDTFESASGEVSSSFKKHSKKSVKSVAAAYTHKEIQNKLTEIFHKYKKDYITGGDIFEKDLVDRLWRDSESVIAGYFNKFTKIIKTHYDRDVEFSISQQEIRSICTQVGKT